MRNIFFIFCAFILVSFGSYAQTIVGKLTDSDNLPIVFANVLIKEAETPTVIQEFVQARNGIYKVVLKKTYTKLLIEVTSHGYLPTTITIDAPQVDSTYTRDFVLSHNMDMDLKEVVVTAKKQPFEVKEDTVSYNVSAYRDGTERKIQDIIKKLPGIEVNEKSGEIKYKGKTVETVTLEGDNLFGHNYSLGTKNINVDMVEQVQAIENYSENPLLKGIENGDKVSLNLKLKKGKIDFSGGTDAGVGVADAGKGVAALNTTLLGITKNYKSFSSASYNNIGRNDTPFDYFGGNIGVEKAKEKNYFAEKAIPENSFSNALDDNRSNVNNAWFANHNSIFKIKKRLSIKTNLYYIQDDIFSAQLVQNTNTINNQIFTTTDDKNIHKRPTQYRADVEMKYNTSKTSLLEYNFRIRQENINTPAHILVNGENNFESNLSSKDFYLKQNILFTKKISARKVLQISMFHSDNIVPQILQFNPSILNPAQNQEDIQKSEFKKSYSEGKATLLGATGKGKYSFSVGANRHYTPFASNLFSLDNAGNIQTPISVNNVRYTQNSIYNLASYNVEWHKWRVSTAYSATQMYQNIDNEITQSKTTFIFEPSLSIKYSLNSVSSLLGRVSYNQSPQVENYLFNNQVLSNNRITVSHTPNLNLQQKTSYGIYYLNNNLDKQFAMRTSVNYQKNTGNFFSNVVIQPRTTQINYFFLPASTDNLNFNFYINKYINFLEADITFTSDYGISNYKNILNNSELRNNQSTNFNTTFAIKTAFDIPVNFHNTFGFSQNQSKNENSGTFINASLFNTFKVMIKPASSWFISLTSEYYLPNSQKKQEDYLFLDALIRFNPKEKKYEFTFILNNLLNINNFQQVQTNDYSINTFQSNLLPRYFMLLVSYNF